jgi:hypothetical protein
MAYNTDYNFEKKAGNRQVAVNLNSDQPILLKQFIDTTEYPLAAEYYKLFAVPAGFTVLNAYVICHTAEAAADTLDIVDDDAATTTFVSAHALNSTSTVGFTNARKRYAAAGYIAMIPSAAITAAKFEVAIEGTIVATTD